MIFGKKSGPVYFLTICSLFFFRPLSTSYNLWLKSFLNLHDVGNSLARAAYLLIKIREFSHTKAITGRFWRCTNRSETRDQSH